MKKEDIKVGGTYTAKISGAVVPVRIVQEKWRGEKHTGWTGLNTKTNRPVNIKSAAKLREEVRADHSEQSDPELPAAPGALPLPGESAGAGAVAAVAGPDAGTAKGRKAKGEKKARAPKTPKPPKEKKLSGLDAAAQVLRKAGKPMGFKEITEGALALGWKTSGKTPAATLYAACIREIAAKKKNSRFRKTERGMFEHSGVEAGKGE